MAKREIQRKIEMSSLPSSSSSKLLPKMLISVETLKYVRLLNISYNCFLINHHYEFTEDGKNLRVVRNKEHWRESLSHILQCMSILMHSMGLGLWVYFDWAHGHTLPVFHRLIYVCVVLVMIVILLTHIFILQRPDELYTLLVGVFELNRGFGKYI